MNRGVGLASRLATYHRSRFYGLVAIAVAYIEPGTIWDIGQFPHPHTHQSITLN